MRVAPRDLKAVRQGGILARYAVLGSVAFVQAEIGPEGSAGTSLEAPCEVEHWGFVISGRLRFEAGELTRTFAAGTAFHIPAGAPAHRFISAGAASVAGFAPLTEPIDDSPEAFAAHGVETILEPPVLELLPASLRLPRTAGVRRTREAGIEAEIAPMGSWTCMRVTYAALSGFTTGWCDLPHWGLVLSGEIVHESEGGVELLTAGDIYWVPPGPPGHRFEVADAATVLDYTPTAALLGPGRRPPYRAAAAPLEQAAGKA